MIPIHELYWMGGAALVGLLALQALFGLLGAMQRVALQHQQRKQEAEFFQIQVEKARWSLVQDITTSRSWSGWRKFELKRKQIEDKKAEVCSFYLLPHDGKPLANYQAGQFLTLRLPLQANKPPVVRCYSLSEAPTPEHYRITVKRVGCPANLAGVPPGAASGYLHDQVAVGDIVDVKTPAGQFFLDVETHRPVVLIGGGIGVTPMISMLRHIAATDPDREAWLFYGVRAEEELIFLTDLEHLRLEHPNLRVHYCLSDVKEEELPDHSAFHAGRISTQFLKSMLPANNFQFYLCGPGAMMQALDEGLRAWGVPEADIHSEKFGPGAVRKAKTPANPNANGAEIVFKKSNKTVPWDEAMLHLWEFAFANDVEIASGCLEGNCGTCQTAILSGAVNYTKTPGFECEEGTCLPCCCTPEGPMELDA